MNLTLAGSCKETGASCKAIKFAFSHSFPNSSSEEVSWKVFPISSSLKATSFSSATITTSSSSWTSVAVMVCVGFCTMVHCLYRTTRGSLRCKL